MESLKRVEAMFK